MYSLCSFSVACLVCSIMSALPVLVCVLFPCMCSSMYPFCVLFFHLSFVSLFLLCFLSVPLDFRPSQVEGVMLGAPLLLTVVSPFCHDIVHTHVFVLERVSWGTSRFLSPAHPSQVCLLYTVLVPSSPVPDILPLQ